MKIAASIATVCAAFSLCDSARAYYCPSQGRWLNRDPIGERGGLNVYSFCAHSPINFIDPLGLVDWRTRDTKYVNDLIKGGNVILRPGQTDTFPEEALGQETGDWTIKVSCVCKNNRWVLNYIKVDFTPVVHLRPSYDRAGGDPTRSQVRQTEFDHVADDKWWARNAGEPLVAGYEQNHLGDHFDDKATCEDALKAEVEARLGASYDAAAARSYVDWDERRPERLHPPHTWDNGWGPRP